MQSIDEQKAKSIIALRRRGYSIPEIHAKIGLPKSTIFRYVKEIVIPKKFLLRLLSRRNASKIIKERNWEKARARARERFSALAESDLALLATALYWGEGSKKDLSLSNSDPDLIRVFLFSLRNVFNVKDEEIMISLRVYEDLKIKECLKFWSDATDIKLDKTTSVNVLKGAKKGKLKFGMCRVRVKRGGLLLKELFSLRQYVIELTCLRSSMDRTPHS